MASCICTLSGFDEHMHYYTSARERNRYVAGESLASRGFSKVGRFFSLPSRKSFWRKNPLPPTYTRSGKGGGAVENRLAAEEGSRVEYKFLTFPARPRKKNLSSFLLCDGLRWLFYYYKTTTPATTFPPPPPPRFQGGRGGETKALSSAVPSASFCQKRN